MKSIVNLYHLIDHVLKEKRNRSVLLGGFGILSHSSYSLVYHSILTVVF